MPPARPARSSVGGRWWHEHDSYHPRLDFSLWRRRVLCSWPLRRQWPRERSWFAPGHCRGALACWRPRWCELVEFATLTPSPSSTARNRDRQVLDRPGVFDASSGACPLSAADASSTSAQQGLAEDSEAVMTAPGLF